MGILESVGTVITTARVVLARLALLTLAALLIGVSIAAGAWPVGVLLGLVTTAAVVWWWVLHPL